MSERLNGWCESTIRDISERVVVGFVGSSKKHYVEKGVPFLTGKNIKKLGLDLTKYDHVSLDFHSKEKKSQLKENDVVVVRIGRSGESAVIPKSLGEANCGGLVIVKQPKIYPDYLSYYLNSPIGIQSSIAEAGGMTRQTLNTQKIAEKIIPIAPLNEQIRIANKLDTLLAKVEAAKTRLEKIPNLLKRSRQSVLAAATSGELTREWREVNQPSPAKDFSLAAQLERKAKGIKESKLSKESKVGKNPFDIPVSWNWVRLGHIALKITDGAHNTPKVLDSGYPYLMAKNLTKGILDFTEKKYISEKDHRELYLKCLPETGDLLVVNIGAGTGNNVLVNVDFEFSFKNIAIIKKPSFVVSEYLKYFFDAQKQRIFNEQTKGGAQPFLSLTVLNEIPFALPSNEEQKEIVRRVESLFALADVAEKQYTETKQRINRLTQSLLAKAFRGELVPQDPNDESAEILLKRIKALREQEMQKIPAKKKSAAKKKAVVAKAKTGKVDVIGNVPESSVEKGFSATAAGMAERLKESFSDDIFTVEQLKEKVDAGYEDLKDGLFELLKGDVENNTKPILKMQWDNGYKLKVK